MSVGRICQRDVDTAEPNETVYCLAERMHQRTIGALVVVDDEARPMGIVTDRDLVIRVLAATRDPLTTPACDVMTPYPKTVKEDTPIELALQLMRSGAFRRLPVVGKKGQLVGIVTLDDIMMLLSEELRDVGKLIASETPAAVANAR